jgi:micrococcal nuclease
MQRVLLSIVLLISGGIAGYFIGAHHHPAPSLEHIEVPTPKPVVSISSDAKKTVTLDMELADGGLYRVRKVIDGDSVILENGVRVCYHGVRAPEMGHYVKDAAPMAQEATQRNVELVEGKQVRLAFSKDPFDIHGRVLARVTLPATDGGATDLDVGCTLVKEGLARAFGLGLSSEDYHALKHIEDDARRDKAGIWSLEDKVRSATPSGKPYCSSGTSSIYHLATCPLAKRIRAENRHEYATLDEAEEAGKNPCRKCVPR